MKIFSIVSILGFWGALAHAEPSLEALKAGTFSTERPAAIAAPPPSAAAAGPGIRLASVQIYQRSGYTFETDARNALNEASANLNAAGIAVLRSEVTRQSYNPWTWGFRLEYVDDQDASNPPVQIESHTSGLYRWQSDASNELNRAASDLRTSGSIVVLGQVLRQSQAPWDYYYALDFVRRGRGVPGGQVFVYTSGLYYNPGQAQREMHSAEYDLRARGYRIYSSYLYQDIRTRYYFFQIRYQGAWPYRREGSPKGK